MQFKSRRDIAFVVLVISQYASNPIQAHYGAVKRILRYPKSTSHLSFVYRDALKPLTGYTVSAGAGDTDTQRSSSEYIFHVGSDA